MQLVGRRRSPGGPTRSFSGGPRLRKHKGGVIPTGVTHKAAHCALNGDLVKWGLTYEAFPDITEHFTPTEGASH